MKVVTLKFNKSTINLDYTLFSNLASYAKSKNVSLMGIIDYEIAKIEKQNEFFIKFPIKLSYDANGIIGTIDINGQQESYKNTIDNTEAYLISKNIQFNKVLFYEQSFSQFVTPKITGCKFILK